MLRFEQQLVDRAARTRRSWKITLIVLAILIPLVTLTMIWLTLR